MSDTLDLSRRILTEKQNKVLSTNIKKDITIFDILGMYSGYLTEEEYSEALSLVNSILNGSGPTPSGEIKLFNTIAEMNNSENNQEGDLAVVYRYIEEGITINKLYYNFIIKNSFTLDTPVVNDPDYIEIYGINAQDNNIYFNAMGTINPTNCELSIYTNNIQATISYTSSDGMNYISESSSLNIEMSDSVEFTIGTWSDYCTDIIFSKNGYFEGMFIFDDNQFKNCRNQFTLSNSGELLPKLTAYGKNGIVTGTDNIYNNIPLDVYFNKTKNLDIPFIGTRYYNNDDNLELTNKTYKLSEDINGQYNFVKANFYDLTELQQLYGNINPIVISSNYMYGIAFTTSTDLKMIKLNLLTNNAEVVETMTFSDYLIPQRNITSVQVNENLGFIAIGNNSNIKVYRFKNGEKETVLDTAAYSSCYPRVSYWNNKFWIYFLTSTSKAAIYSLEDVDSQMVFAKQVNFQLPINTSSTVLGIVPTSSRLYFVSADEWGMDSSRHSNFDNINTSGTWSSNSQSSKSFLTMTIGSDGNLYFLGSSKAKYKITATSCTTSTWDGSVAAIDGYYDISKGTITSTYGPSKGSYFDINPYESHYTKMGRYGDNYFIGNCNMGLSSFGSVKLLEDYFCYKTFIPDSDLFITKHGLYNRHDDGVTYKDKEYLVIANHIKCNIEESTVQGNTFPLGKNILMKYE